MGFAVAEPVYASTTYENRQYIGLQKLKVLPAETIEFRTDEHGNLLNVYQNVAGRARVDLTPMAKFIIWPFNMRAGNWYGRSLLKRSYKHWYIKDACFCNKK